jgi:hypothetical protein
MMAKLNTPAYNTQYRKIIMKYEDGDGSLLLQAGRPKQQSHFPSIGFEIMERRKTWAATNYTRDLEFQYKVYVSIKNILTIREPDALEAEQVGDSVVESENYIIELSEYVEECMNEVLTQTFEITHDDQGTILDPPTVVYDSGSGSIQYGFLYNQALRIGVIDFFAKIMLSGPSGGGRGY